MQTRLIVTPGPHILTTQTTERIMLDVCLALAPASIAAVYFFGWRALAVIALATAAAIGSEALIQWATGRQVTVVDGSAALTGLLLALILPPSVPLWIPVVGSVFAIAIGKQVFGGLGTNTFNPALIGRAFLTASWPVLMTTWTWPEKALSWLTSLPNAPDAVTSATPLALLRFMQVKVPWQHLFSGEVAGSLGETSALALLLGGAYLILKRIIDWRTPAAYLGTVFVLSLLYRQDPLFHLLAGGLMIGAFFMATDYVTTPCTPKGRIIFGVGTGLLTVLIRRFGGYPEGVCYSILIMNAFTPLINRFTVPRIFGEVKARA